MLASVLCLGVCVVSKSTMIKLIRGELQPQEGVCRLNPHARAVLFTQHHIDQLDLSKSTMDYLQFLFPQAKEHKIRGVMSAPHHTSNTHCTQRITPHYTTLDTRAADSTASCQAMYSATVLTCMRAAALLVRGRFGFDAHLVQQKIGQLSGGQRSRVAFAILTFKEPHLIIMVDNTAQRRTHPTYTARSQSDISLHHQAALSVGITALSLTDDRLTLLCCHIEPYAG